MIGLGNTIPSWKMLA